MPFVTEDEIDKVVTGVFLFAVIYDRDRVSDRCMQVIRGSRNNPNLIARNLGVGRIHNARVGFTASDVIKHLSNVIAEAEKSGTVEVLPMRHRIDYTVTIPANIRGAQAGSRIQVWLPFPQEYRQQNQIKLLEATPKLPDLVIAQNGVPHRTVCFTHTIDDPSTELIYKLAFEYTSSAYYPILKEELAKPTPADFDRQYLDERPPHIAFSPQLKETIGKIIGDETNPLARVRKIFHWVDANIKYHAEEEYCTIPSFSGACLSRHKGNCGVQSMLFVR